MAAITFVLVACKTPTPDTALKTEAVAVDPVGRGIELGEFDTNHEPQDTLLKKLGQRVGCAVAAKTMIKPKQSSLQNAIANLSANTGAQGSYYDHMRAVLMDQAYIEQSCKDLVGNDTEQDALAGIKKIMNLADGITFVMIGGFGSHAGALGALEDSRGLWTTYAKTLADPSRLRVWRLDCSNSYASDDRCSKEIIDLIKKREEKEPSAAKHKFIIWGYSKGGNTGLQALMESRELRSRTLALITNASPLGGGIPMTLVVPALTKALAARDKILGKPANNPLLQLPGLYIMAQDPHVLSQAEFHAQFVAELDQVKGGADSIHPATRKKFLYERLKNADFSRDAEGPLPVFHLAGVVDVAALHPLPAMTFDDGRIVGVKGSANGEHLGELAMLPLFRDFPLADTCVALQHAVIPRDALPPGLTSELIGVMQFDHASFRLTAPTNDDRVEVPNVAFVDAVLDTVAERLTGP